MENHIFRMAVQTLGTNLHYAGMAFVAKNDTDGF